MEGSDALIPNVKALLLYRKCDGLVTSRGPDLHGRLERERERERERELAMYYSQDNPCFVTQCFLYTHGVILTNPSTSDPPSQ